MIPASRNPAPAPHPRHVTLPGPMPPALPNTKKPPAGTGRGLFCMWG